MRLERLTRAARGVVPAGRDTSLGGALRGVADSPLVRNPVTRRARTATLQADDIRVVLASGAFDQDWYQAQAGRTFGSRLAAVTHYVRSGRRAGHGPHPLFEAAWVDPTGWSTARRDPYAQFLRSGGSSDRSPHPCFDPAAWRAEHPDASACRLGAYGHFLQHAGESTRMPPAQGGEVSAALSWGEFRQASWEQLRAWVAERSTVEAARTTTVHDAAADAAFVRRWSRAPLRTTGPGPLVSVVMPVRNRPDEVARAIASVRAQTLLDWELVVVDDGSDDSTPDVVAALCEAEPRVVLHRGAHQGVSAARNVGARHATGRYLAWLDSDNVWTPDFLQVAVAAMQDTGARAAYAEAELRSPRGTRYRSLGGSLEHLAHRNHVDLNVLVADRELVADVGGFDEALRRTVDYDLVWRLALRTPLVHLPFVGVVYDEDGASDRVTTRELRSWRDVVRNKHLVGWAALERDLDHRVDGRTSVVVAARTGWRAAWSTASAVLAAGEKDPVGDGPPQDVELVLVDSALRRGDATVLRWLVTRAGGEGRAAPHLLRLGTTGRTALTWNVGLGSSTGDVVAFLDEGLAPSDGWTGPLRRALLGPDRDARAGLVQPVVVGADGVVATAGGSFTGTDVLPAPLLQGCPVDDVSRLPGPVRLGCVDGPAVAVRAADVVRAQGFTCLYEDGWEAADLSMRLMRDAGLTSWVVPASTVVVGGVGAGDMVREATNRRLFRDTWRDSVPSPTSQAWEAVGLRVVRHDASPVGTEVEPRRPWAVLARAESPAGAVPRLRWAVKTAVPFGPDAHRWGDLHFARALADALRRLGQDVSVDYRGGLARPTAGVDDVVVALRGRVAVPVRPGTLHVLWVISHPDLVADEEVRAADMVYAASLSWARRTTQRLHRSVEPLLQATDPGRFHPAAAERGTGEPLLFVGNSRNVYRPVVRHLVRAGLPVAVYGGRWEQFIDSRHLRDDNVDNADLPALYSSAGVVLNDHWDGMREEGFWSNRLFDAAATGARVISDDVAGMAGSAGVEVFGGLVRTFRTGEELVDLVRRVDEVFPPEPDRLVVAERVRREHSFDARARTLLDAVLSRSWQA